jgi:multicomponent Na+:H+ antiporter subunit C
VIETAVLYGLTGVVLAALGLRAVLLQPEMLRKILAVNVMGVGVFLLLVAAAYRGPAAVADPVPHALVLTGIVVAVAATALGLALLRRIEQRRSDGHDD